MLRLLTLTTIFTSAFLLFSCNASKKVTDETEEVDNQEVSSAKSGAAEKLLFLGFQYKGEEVILVVNKVVPGKLKDIDTMVPMDDPKEGELVLQQIDGEGNVIHYQHASNPRSRVVEYADDNGVLTSKKVEVPDAEFNFRVPVFSETKEIRLYDTTGKETKKLIYTYKL